MAARIPPEQTSPPTPADSSCRRCLKRSSIPAWTLGQSYALVGLTGRPSFPRGDPPGVLPTASLLGEGRKIIQGIDGATPWDRPIVTENATIKCFPSGGEWPRELVS